jgi:antibiotic biosynthesis monooxygenase (ABM) superfamily enzyme
MKLKDKRNIMNRFTSFIKGIPGYLSSTKESINETIQQIQNRDEFYMNLKNHNEKKIMEYLNSSQEQEILHGLNFLIAVIDIYKGYPMRYLII